jgi:hypothetical protein
MAKITEENMKQKKYAPKPKKKKKPNQKLKAK